MALNVSSSFRAVMGRQLSKRVLPIAQRHIVAQHFAKEEKLEKGFGVTWQATRFNPVPLPQAPLSEGVAPIGQQLSFSQVTGVALQWGDKISFSDVAVITTMFDLLEKSKEQLGIQMARLMERNTFAVLMGGTQVNYVNSRGSRASLVAGDVLDTQTTDRTYADLANEGAFFYNGSTTPNINRRPESGAREVTRQPMASNHYVAIVSTLVANDYRQNPTIQLAWSRSDITRLYNHEVGYWGGVHFVESNMMPRFTGIATAGSPVAGTSGSLATGTYYIQITGTDTLGYFGESQNYQVSSSVSVTGPNGSIQVTMPATTGYTYGVYLDTSSSPQYLASATGAGVPTTGPLTGVAWGIAPGTVITLTAKGPYQVPPAAPATGVTVYRTLVFGRDAFACTKLEDVTWTSLMEADKSDELNQRRVIGYKFFQGYVILNNQFMAGIESSVSNTGTYG